MEKKGKKEVFEKEEYKRAAEKAMSLLLVQDRTEKGLRERLNRADFSEEAVDFAIKYVRDYGYLDDYRFASNYIEFRKGTKSRRELRYKLLQKGVSEEIAVQALAGYDVEEELSALRNQLYKKLKGRNLVEMDYKEKQKVMSYLSGKGYEISHIRAVTEEFMQNENH